MKGVDFYKLMFRSNLQTHNRKVFMKKKIIVGLFAMSIGMLIPSIKANAYPIAGATRQIQQIMADYHKRLNQDYEIGYTNTTVNKKNQKC